MTSKLDEILENFEYWKYTKMGGVRTQALLEKRVDREQAKQQIKDLMLEIIGEDEVLDDGYGEGLPDQRMHTRNVLKRELRKKIEEL